MKEIKTILNKYDELMPTDQRLALATLVHVENSSYRRSGARMLIAEDGTWTGGISGGCLEGDTLLKAKQAIVENKAITIRYDTRDGDPNQIGVGLGCNGLIDVLVTPIDSQNDENQIEVLRKCTQHRSPNVLLTVVKCSPGLNLVGKLVDVSNEYDFAEYFQNETLVEQITYDIKKVKLTKQSTSFSYRLEGEEWVIFVEYLPPPIALYICGKNYDTIPLAELAKKIGWTVNVVANPIKVSKTLYEIVDNVITQKHSFPELDYHSVILLMAHDYDTDLVNFSKSLSSKAPYIGILGPKKRSDKMLAELKVRGIETGQERIYAPVGLDTGAASPEEIAIAILAEIRTFYSGRKGGFLKDRFMPINDNTN